MGLDMYLYKKTYVKNWNHMSESERHEISVNRGGKPVTHIKPERISNIVEEVGYWRKSNQIHNWFVENVQEGVDNCQESYVDPEKLRELLSVCKQVKEDTSQAEVLLPTQSGFFFGGTDYDEWYFKDIDDTIELLEGLVNEDGFDQSDFYYQSSW